MSYCRWSDKNKEGKLSEAYIYPSKEGYVCYWKDGESFIDPDLWIFMGYIRGKWKAGKIIPEFAIDSLMKELHPDATEDA